MHNNSRHHGTEQRGIRLLAHPRLLLSFTVLLVLAFGAGLGNLSKEPSVDAFVPGDHPAALARDAARERFGLEDPVIVGVEAAGGGSMFTAERLSAFVAVDAAVRSIEGVRHRDVVSLASEQSIRGQQGDLVVEPIIEPGAVSPRTAALAQQRFEAMPMLSGLLASADGRMLVIIAPVDDPNHAGETVAQLRTAAIAAGGENVTVHVAGVAAMNARLADMVDSDTRVFVPAAIVTVLLILFVAMRTGRAVVGPLVVIAGSAAIAIGLMGWLDARYYLITTALPVVIMAIAVADSLHICSFYLKARAQDARLDARAAVTCALGHTWVPITLTSVTTIAAFIGLSLGAAMQPISEFGLFAAVGVAAAWALSLTALPAILILTDTRPSERYRATTGTAPIEQYIARLSQGAFHHPRRALGLVVALIGVLAVLAANARFDYERQQYFVADDAVRVADRQINAALGGMNFLDVMVSADAPGGLLHPDAMRAISALRASIADLPLVVKVSGIDQYISLMHEVLTDAPRGALPDGARAPGQYLFLYEASGEPEDFKQEIDYDYQHALVRAQLSTDRFSATLPVVDSLSQRVTEWRAQSGLDAQISGRVAVNDGWMSRLAEHHFRGLGLASALVLITVLLVFRSFPYAILAMVPLCIGVLAVYATMGAFNIDIAPATSMTAAIATGLGVDFGIHLISHIRRRLAAGDTVASALQDNYLIVARACFYSAVALGVALAVICISSAPPLRWFGFLVSVGAFGSLLGALIMIPGLLATAALFDTRRLQHV